MKEGTNLFEGQIALKVTFPYTLEREICDKLLKKEEIDAPPEGMYIQLDQKYNYLNIDK